MKLCTLEMDILRCFLCRLIHMMSQDAFSGDDDLYINLLQNIRMMMECPPSLGEKVSLGIYSGLRASKKWGEMGK